MNFVKTGKKISYALRHNPEKYGLILDKEGFVKIEDLLFGLEKGENIKLTLDDIKNIMDNTDKIRYEIVGEKIRATYGHSKVKVIKNKIVPPKFLYHGTSHKAYEKIKEEGIKPMNRQFVHLSEDIETAIKVGKRRDKNPVIIKIDAQKAYEEGVNFYEGNDTTYISEMIIPCYFFNVKIEEEPRYYYLFAGVNGAGKTTFYNEQISDKDNYGPRINTDEIVVEIGNPRNSVDQIRATRIAIDRRNKYMRSGITFHQETTLTGKTILKAIEKAKKFGYKVVVYYFGLNSPELAKERVAIRVSKGGHHIDDDVVERRYVESLKNLKKIHNSCDELVIYDNSFESYKKCLVKRKEEVVWHREFIDYATWLKKTGIFYKNDLLSWILAEQKVRLNNRIYEYSQIDFSYNSNKMEGGRLNYLTVSDIFESGKLLPQENVVRMEDLIECNNHFYGFDFILKTLNQELTEKLIKRVHYILKSATKYSFEEIFNLGGYKIIENRVGYLSTTPAKYVADEMEELIRKYNLMENKKLEDIIEFHYRFEKIHPFTDGNGRVGRLIMFRECLKNKIVPFILEEEQYDGYFKGLREYEKDKSILIKVCMEAQEKYRKIMKSLDIDC